LKMRIIKPTQKTSQLITYVSYTVWSMRITNTNWLFSVDLQGQKGVRIIHDFMNAHYATLLTVTY